MDEQLVQEVKAVSREIVEKEFPEEEEYFDFLSNLIIPELQKLKPGEEPQFLREIRAVHPLALGCTAVVITIVFQVLTQIKYRVIEGEGDKDGIITEESIKKVTIAILGNTEVEEQFSEIPKILMEHIEKAKMKVKEK